MSQPESQPVLSPPLQSEPDPSLIDGTPSADARSVTTVATAPTEPSQLPQESQSVCWIVFICKRLMLGRPFISACHATTMSNQPSRCSTRQTASWSSRLCSVRFFGSTLVSCLPYTTDRAENPPLTRARSPSCSTRSWSQRSLPGAKGRRQTCGHRYPAST